MNEEAIRPVYWTTLMVADTAYILAATEQGLCYVGSPNEGPSAWLTWARKRLPNHTPLENNTKTKPYQHALLDYFHNDARTISIPLDLHGTPFQLAVWQKLADVPFGSTSSYSDIAAALGRPSSVRAVGTAIGANPVLIAVPCHRILGKNGSLTGYRGGLTMKRMLLQLEQQVPHSGHIS
ncbi:methylated-DNA--[protein]-cysteine S-methyltransferase [Paenibacillus sp. GCM10023252]|uniref:methylated-DNA--[protein]-cysteine S-methyltransferase n=1 Tax=Paenibacillus sp. GCM10023252 TaxID=3252649 RepID=UPI0036076373